MPHTIKKVYVIHHSHTDIGYTDLQERVIDTQVDYIRTALRMMEQPENADFRWNCETLFCVEEFLKTASAEEADKFFALVSTGKMGISANYLNFNDLVDAEVYAERLQEWSVAFARRGAPLRTAMCADINGISMGQRDALLSCGVEFLFTNIHCHHGMYPLYQNQNAYRWQNAAGQSLLVWNGEHYNLGNALGIKPNRAANFMMENLLGGGMRPQDPVETLHESLDSYLTLCEENHYPYDFIPSSVSGVFSDNAPPEPEILRTIQAHNERYGDEVQLQMVSLQEFYALVKAPLAGCPVLHGDLNDWWANGVGSTPYAVKHYRDAQHRYHLCRRLDSQVTEKQPELARTVQDNLMLYAEHTWGHSSTVGSPYDTMVLNLDTRKTSYASKAHEAASRMLNQIAREKGDTLRYYNTNGKIRVCNPSAVGGALPVEFYIESPILGAADILTEDGKTLTCQVSPHPRGRRITFTDTFAPHESKTYQFREKSAVPQPLNSRKCYVGAERIRDIVNDYDPLTYRLPYGFENEFFRLDATPQNGVTAFVDKRCGKNLLDGQTIPFFTPIYERTPLGSEAAAPLPGECIEREERRLLGRNVRGRNAEVHAGKLEEVLCCEHGPVFTIMKLRYTLPGTVHACVYLKFYEAVPRIDFRLELGKTLSSDIESVYLPMTLNYADRALWMRKGTEAYRPGVDQLPGTCMEYTMSDDGLACLAPQGGALIAAKDTPLFYFGELRHHPIHLCDGKPENNARPVYNWLMNNTWETNFKMDLSGFCEFCYTLWLTDESDPETAMNELRERCFDPYVLIVE